MKKLLLYFLFFSAASQAQIVNIPDANFKAKLLSEGIDVNSDGEIQLTEAAVVTSLNLYDSNISSLEGILAFTNLQNLSAYNNSIQTLNVSGLTHLFNIDVGNNLLMDLNIDNCFALHYLWCQYNQLTSLDVSDMENLQLRASNNSLTNIVLSEQGYYEALILDHNQLQSIDLSGRNLPGLVHLEYNQLSSINLENTHVNNLYLQNNMLETVDLETCVGLNYVNLSENLPLETIFAKNGRNESFSLGYDLNLSFICVDDFQLSGVQQTLNSYSLSSAVVSPYCTIFPGGNYNTITGNVTFDTDNNGCDGNDPDQPYVKLTLTSGNDNYTVFTSPDGNYTNFGQAGTFNVSVAAENMSMFTITPPLATILFGNNNNNITTQDFCITANGIQNDLETVIVPNTPARPGFDATYKIIYKNKGNQVLSGSVDFTYQENELDFVNASTTPDAQTAGSLSWNFSNLYPFESRSIEVRLNVNSPQETPAVNIGDQLGFHAQANPVGGDVTPGDNTFSFKQTVVGSYDPNDITCLEGEHVNPTEIGKYLHYNINFENTGTAAAENIVVKDMIDLTKFDISTLQVLHASHPVTPRITNDKVEFIFEGINLGASERGNVTFKIKTKNTLVTGNSVSQKADIYFDYNFPVATNLAVTTFDALGTDEQTLDNRITIYPNPASDRVTIRTEADIQSVVLFDVRGREFPIKAVSGVIDLSGFADGAYLVKVQTDNGYGVQRIIKQ
ncbi:hypothetical protein HYN48_00465 [Flavobacterium magnum]|uniref:Uncharacterized protein n=1 Tax=Flavobacterium magnum TaxID=2162713 RepID=A0A2S0R9H9_9FLAO|nr:T9SS type A sorting domain-containing protein [Flavobacterium magnum]AWA28677.1 hypothetical protein HYN48_00465 [Flavobacterium magnum]